LLKTAIVKNREFYITLVLDDPSRYFAKIPYRLYSVLLIL